MTETSSNTITKGIRIQVYPEFLPEYSDTENFQFFFKYRIVITNESDEPVKLISRKWLIINADGDEEIVEGLGVVGQNPYIQPSENFEYESNCPLNTPWGTMEGSYNFRKNDGSDFDATISRFYLVSELQEH
ncbi:MAG TPA: Co2+/Mg2+ efflux protein ApaG [Ignavibacteria bacterium]|nr:Co2+/Mg2+ efflux protein ApaG [Ignavibacteria bacterium]